MKTTHTWLWAAAVLSLAGCSRGPALESGNPDPLPELTPQAPEAPAPAPVEVRPQEPGQIVSATLSATVSLLPEGAQGVRTVDHVGLHVELTGAEGAHTLGVAFLTPSGATYQFGEQQVNGSAHEPVGVDFTLPVAGTVIDAHNLGGEWTAKVFFDGEEHSQHSFELAP